MCKTPVLPHRLVSMITMLPLLSRCIFRFMFWPLYVSVAIGSWLFSAGLDCRGLWYDKKET
jgi:hypothetical protein